MTSAEFAAINQRRLARGQQPLTFTESPRKLSQTLQDACRLPRIATAASMLADKRERETKKKTARLDAANGSHLEQRFLRLWTDAGGPPLERELRFEPPRRWRFDFAHRESMTAFEIDGGVWGGRHTRGNGFLADAEKLLAAHLAGWRVVRLTAPQLTAETIGQLVRKLSSK